MAIDPSTKYPGQTDTSDAVGYPYGAAQNITVVGDGSGTPLEKTWISDIWGFLQSLLVVGGVTPNGSPDKVGASQYLSAIVAASWTWLGNHVFTQDVLLAAGKEVKYAVATTRTILIDLSKGQVQSGTAELQSTGWHLKSSSTVIAFAIDAPSNGAVTNLKAGMLQGTTPSSAFFGYFLRRVTPVKTGSGGAPAVADSGAISCTAAGDQIKGVAVSSAVHNDVSRLEVVVAASDSAATADDVLRFIEIQFTEAAATGHF